MFIRKNPLINDHIYHILNKSIAGYEIFNTNNDYNRFMEIINYYRHKNIPLRYSQLKSLHPNHQKSIIEKIKFENERIVDIIAYCIMPTHIHLLLKQKLDKGITIFVGNILNSYSKYFNMKYGRKGPLWEGRFKNVLVENDRQLRHLSRYIHLNPVSAGLVDKPEEWTASSYMEYVSENKKNGLCNYKDIIDIRPNRYKHFVNERIDYQKQISYIKKQIME